MKEYTRGMENELYCVDLSPAFNRQFFNCVAHQAFVLFGVVVLGVETRKSLYRSDVAANDDSAKVPSEQQLRRLAEQQAVSLGLVGTAHNGIVINAQHSNNMYFIFIYSAPKLDQVPLL